MSAFASKAVIQVNPILTLALRLSASGGGRVGPAIGKIIPKAKRSTHRHPGAPRRPLDDIVVKTRPRFYEIPQNFHGQIYCRMWEKYGVAPGVEFPLTPDGPDVLDGVVGLAGRGVIGLHRVRQLKGIFLVMT
jgi:hypothetical protein